MNLRSLFHRRQAVTTAPRTLLPADAAGLSATDRADLLDRVFWAMDAGTLRAFLEDLPAYGPADREAFIDFVASLRRLLVWHHAFAVRALDRTDPDERHEMLGALAMDPHFETSSRRYAAVMAAYRPFRDEDLRRLVLGIEDTEEAKP